MGLAPGITPELARQNEAALRSIAQSYAILKERQLVSPAELREIEQEILALEAALYPPDPVTFLEYSSKTTPWPLFEWQKRILCPIIERCLTEKGLRILFHVGPQMGKSSQLSMRAPAYLLGRCPTMRVALACYNITHAASFGGVVRDLINGPEHVEFFPDPGCRIPKKASEQEFITLARKAMRTAQPSFQAMGLLTGFVGRGIDAGLPGGPADLLIIDDPYASPDDAKSEAVNERVWRFWKEAASPRVDEDANVIVMFHRYHEDDLAGRLLAEGGWEYIRLPAIRDENVDGSDPTHQPEFADIREPDGRLSPRRSMAYLNAQMASDTFVFLGQFQGTPRAAGGNLFKEADIRRYRETEDAYILNGEVIPKTSCYLIQTGDLAATEKEENDWTCLGTWAVTPRHQLLLLHVERVKRTGPEVKRLIRAQYYLWRPAFVALDKTGLGLPIVQDLEKGEPDAGIPAIPVRGLVMHLSKKARAEGAAGRYVAGLMYHPENGPGAPDWLFKFEDELTGFPNATNDDQVDMVSTATACISSPTLVFPEFSPAGHVSLYELPLIDGPPLLVGWGLDPVPAWVVAQEFGGQLRILASHAARPGTGFLDTALALADRLKQEFGPELDSEHYAACRPGTTVTMHQDVANLLAYGDGDREGPGWLLGQAEERREVRDEAVRNRLKTMSRGMPALFFDPACGAVIEALASGYALKQQQNGALSDAPEKNAAFALCEALGCVVTSVYASGYSAKETAEEWAEHTGTASGAGRRRR